MAKHADIVAVRTTLELAEQAGKAGPLGELEGRVAANPPIIRRGSTWRWPSSPLAAARRRSTICSEMFRRNRGWNEDAARKQLVKLFDAMGADRSADRRRPQAPVVPDVLLMVRRAEAGIPGRRVT